MGDIGPVGAAAAEEVADVGRLSPAEIVVEMAAAAARGYWWRLTIC